MQGKSVPLSSVTIGPQMWRDKTLRSIQRAQSLVRETWVRGPADRSRPRSVGFPPRNPEEAAGDESRAEGRGDSRHRINIGRSPQTTRATRTPLPPFPPSLREQCAAASVAVATEYMRRVREVTGRLRRQAVRVTEEGTKLEKERAHLEKGLYSIKSSQAINKRSLEGRDKRPATTEMERDRADDLLLWERRELAGLKQDLEGALRETQSQLQALGESSKKLLDCISERARVLDLLPQNSSAGAHRTKTQRVDSIGPFTPECASALEASSSTVSQSRLLRERIRRLLTNVITKQNAVHRTVSNGLIKKIAENVNLQENLTVTCAATRQAAFRKQREINCIHHSYGRAQGPESNRDFLLREKLNRPLVRVYQRHPGTDLPEAAHLMQASAVLRQCVKSSEGDLEKLQHTRQHLLHDLHGKQAAAQVDTAVVRMRRHQVDNRCLPFFLQQAAS